VQVDNEHMGRLRSNCCCVYVPPREWDADTSSDEEDDTWVTVARGLLYLVCYCRCCGRRKSKRAKGETEHCRGHTPADKTKEPSAK